MSKTPRKSIEIRRRTPAFSKLEVGQRLKGWRTAKNISQREAGELVGVEQATWSDWESGKKSLSVPSAIRVSAATDIPLADLTGLAIGATGTDG